MPIPLPLSVVVPLHNSVSTLRAALAAIRASEIPRDHYELIAVDDASTDASASVAARYADTVIRLSGRPHGAAYASNRGAELARGDVVAFVNPDVLVEPDTLSKMLEIFAGDPGIGAVSASHDANPGAPNFVSQYWNLLLHFGERRHSASVGDLASGCSAVRRSLLIEAGMYDEWKFGGGSIEGLELGQRLGGGSHRVLAAKDLQVMHLKKWTVGSLSREIWNRSRMLTRSLGYEQTRAAVPSEVVFTLSRAMPSALAVISSVALAGAAFHPAPTWSVKIAVAFAGILAANLPVYRFYADNRGLAFAILAMPVHLMAQTISAIALCVGWVLRDMVGDRSPDAVTQAYAEVGLERWPPVPRRSHHRTS